MSTPNDAAAPAVVPAAAPAPLVTQTPPAVAPPPAELQTTDPFVAQLLSDMGKVVKDGEISDAPSPGAPTDARPSEISGVTFGERVELNAQQRELDAGKKTTEVAAQPAPSPGTETPAATTAAPVDPPKAVVKKKAPASISLPLPPTTPAPAPPPAAPAPAPAPVPVVDAYESSLTDIQREELQFARYAAEKMPDKYKELPSQLLGFFKQVDAHIESGRKDGSDRTFDETDSEFQRFLKEKRPRYIGSDRKALEREQITESVVKQAEAQNADKFRAMEERQRVLEIKPQVDAAMTAFSEQVESLLSTAPESPAAEIIATAQTQGWEEAVKSDPINAPIVRESAEMASRRARAYLSVTTGLEQFNERNPDHAWILRFMAVQGEHFKANGGEQTKRMVDGVPQTFVTRGEYGKLLREDPARASQHFTFTDQDIIQMLAVNARQDAVVRIKNEETRLAASGYERKAKVKVAKSEAAGGSGGVNGSASIAAGAPPASTPVVVASGAPRAGASPGPGAGSTAVPLTPGAMNDMELRALGLKV